MRHLKISKSLTVRESASLDKYLQEIGRLSLITSEEEVDLASRIKKGDHDAVDKLVKANLRFVVSISKQYQNMGLSLPDLINEGNLGLIKASERFDETRGFKFISYAVWWIRQNIIQALAENSRVVRIPANQINLFNKINRATVSLEQKNEYKPAPEEIADYLNLSIDDVKDSIRASRKNISVDESFSEEENDFNLLDVLVNDDSPEPDKLLIEKSLSFELERALNTIPEREAMVIRKIYFQNKTLIEIGDEIGLSQEMVRQIKKKAIKRLSTHYRCQNLKQFLG